MRAHFVSEVPFPEANGLIYRELYEYEQLFRRLAHAAMVARSGSQWSELLPDGLLAGLKMRQSRLENRIHLSCENSRNPIWITTLEELRVILAMDSIWPIVREFSSYKREFLDSKFSELIEIRNVIGHNRAATGDTVAVWQGIATSLRPGLDRFKAKILYRSDDLVHLDDEPSDNAVVASYSRRCRGNDWGEFQPMLSESRYFYSLTHLPVDTEGGWVRASQLLEFFESVADRILCFMVNLSGNEFSVVWPKVLSQPDQEKILESFWTNARGVWTHTQYEDQSPAYVCDPQIWFYENRRPVRE